MTELYSFIEPLQTAAGRGSLTLSFDKKRVPSRGKDVEARCQLTFEESVRGCARAIAFRAMGSCAQCDGQGYFRLSESECRWDERRCSFCSGTGTYSRKSSILTINSTCSHCNGEGFIHEIGCRSCTNGRVEEDVELTIEIPAGMIDGMRMIYPAQGDAGEFGGEAGDLVVAFGIDRSPNFVRQGNDVITTVNVSFFQAALGGEVAVRNIFGEQLRLPIPPGTQPDSIIRVEGAGFCALSSMSRSEGLPLRGDMLVKVNVSIPKQLTPHQTTLLCEAQRKWPNL